MVVRSPPSKYAGGVVDTSQGAATASYPATVPQVSQTISPSGATMRPPQAHSKPYASADCTRVGLQAAASPGHVSGLAFRVVIAPEPAVFSM